MPTLNWIGKDAVVNHHHDVTYKTLDKQYTFVNGETIIDNGRDGVHTVSTENKIIHGDNLEALKALLPEYEGRIKCIYIDPPYNTGNENWVYNDNVNSPRIRKWLGQVVGKEAEDLTRHDKWLCMMYPRLKLLQLLLSNNGIVFISIDDNESTYLKLLCDEIFGSANFRGQITIVGNPGGRDYGGIARMHEYVLVYSKTSSAEIYLIKDKEHSFKLFDNQGGFELRELRNRNVRFNKENRPNLYYPFYIDTEHPDNNGLFPISIDPVNGWYELWPQPSQGINVVWRWGKDKSTQNLNINICGKAKKDGGYMIVEKYREERKMAGSVWWDKETRTESGTLLVKDIFNNKSFDYPKPIELVMRCIEMGSGEEPNSIILDSFAGSGTTAHAVLNLNKQDGGNRKFILVEMEDYAENITAERVRRVINGYGEGKNKTEGTSGGFSYYELGEPIMNGDYLNENQPIEKIREYIWYSETHTALRQAQGSAVSETPPEPVEGANIPADNPCYLGNHNNVGYYFYYEKNTTTTLDKAFLNTISVPADQYIIYADNCLLSDEFMRLNNIVFKKIPRDIRKF